MTKPERAKWPAHRKGPEDVEVQIWYGGLRALIDRWAEESQVKTDKVTAFAEAVKISKSFLYRIMKADPLSGAVVNPNLSFMILLAAFFRVPVDSLISWRVVEKSTGEVIHESTSR